MTSIWSVIWKILVSLLVRLWVEIDHTIHWTVFHQSQPPCEAVSWNVSEDRSFRWDFTSASLWGCELKCLFCLFYNLICTCQPPCEAVSWNLVDFKICRKPIRQPPCEAVSWNAFSARPFPELLASASLWGCELKYSVSNILPEIPGQPPCEAVSWNIPFFFGFSNLFVSLLVRLWVEIKLLYSNFCSPLSASLWGCELKYIFW